MQTRLTLATTPNSNVDDDLRRASTATMIIGMTMTRMAGDVG